MITVKHLSKTFINPDGSLHEVLKDVSCEIHKGEVIGIIGPSGTGKSTFLQTLNLMTPPTTGEIYFENENILSKGYPINKLRQRMGMVFQSFNLFDHLNVLENLTLAPMKLKGLSQVEAEKEAMAMLHKVGLDDRCNAMPSDLAGGQRQRVAIARSLVMQPEVMLFDEPLSALDPSMVGEVMSVIRQLAKEGMTMLIVTHKLKFAHDVCSRIFFMYDGGIHEDGTPEQIFEHPVHSATKAFVQRIYKQLFEIQGPAFDMMEMHAQMMRFCQKYNFAEKIDNIRQITDKMVLSVMASYRPLTVRISYSEQHELVSLDFMVKDMKSSPLRADGCDSHTIDEIRDLSREIIEEPTKLGFRVKVIV